MMAWSGRFDDFKQFEKSDNSRNYPTNNRQSSGPSAVNNRMQHLVQNNEAISQSSNQHSSGLTKIRDIYPDMPNVTILGMVLTKDGPKSIISKKNSGTERHLLALTVRDEPNAFINVTCWGNIDFINNVNNIIIVGNVVQIRNAQVQGKQNNSNDEQYKPSTPSMPRIPNNLRERAIGMLDSGMSTEDVARTNNIDFIDDWPAKSPASSMSGIVWTDD